MKPSLAVLVLTIVVMPGFAQTKVKKIAYRSVNQVGVLTGTQRDALLIQTINGISFQDWSAGVGVGIDNYSERSIPIFIDVRKSFGKNSNAPFTYVDGGINLSWLNFIQRENRFFPEYKQPSWYYDAGVGWKFFLGNKSVFIMSAGFSLKQLKGERVGYGPVIGGQVMYYPEKFENTYRRIVIKMGIQF